MNYDETKIPKHKLPEDNTDFQKLMTEEKNLNKNVARTGQTMSVISKVAWLLIIIGTLCSAFAITDKIALKKFSEISGLIGWVAVSFWALGGFFFIYSIFLSQKQQILVTKIETKFNEIELKTTSIEHEVLKHRFNQLHDSVRMERFENSFFQLLSVHNVMVNSMNIEKIVDNEPVISKGRDCFASLFQQFLQKSRFVYESDLDKIMKHYESFFCENQADLGHYFGNLYHMIKYVDSAEVEDKKKYITFIRTQLSNYELALLFYNCISKQGTDTLKPLIEKYALLKDLPKTLVIDLAHMKLFNPSAFNLSEE